jgi:hypothetical protein
MLAVFIAAIICVIVCLCVGCRRESSTILTVKCTTMGTDEHPEWCSLPDRSRYAAIIAVNEKHDNGWADSKVYHMLLLLRNESSAIELIPPCEVVLGRFESPAFTPEGRWLICLNVVSTSEKSLVVWDLSQRKQAARLYACDDPKAEKFLRVWSAASTKKFTTPVARVEGSVLYIDPFAWWIE